MKADEFVELIAKLNTNEKAFSLGTIDGVSGGKARIKFDGENVTSSKYYSRLTSYSPVSGHRVLVANIAGSHVILGQIS
jgi:hypothetical protein